MEKWDLFAWCSLVKGSISLPFSISLLSPILCPFSPRSPSPLAPISEGGPGGSWWMGEINKTDKRISSLNCPFSGFIMLPHRYWHKPPWSLHHLPYHTTACWTVRSWWCPYQVLGGKATWMKQERSILLMEKSFLWDCSLFSFISYACSRVHVYWASSHWRLYLTIFAVLTFVTSMM